MHITGVTNGGIADGTGIGTIVADDAVPPPTTPPPPDDVTGFGFYLLARWPTGGGFSEGSPPGLWFEMDVYSLSPSPAAG